MPPVLPEHQSIIIRDHAHGQGRGDGNQVWSRWKQIACRAEFSLKQFWEKDRLSSSNFLELGKKESTDFGGVS